MLSSSGEMCVYLNMAARLPLPKCLMWAEKGLWVQLGARGAKRAPEAAPPMLLLPLPLPLPLPLLLLPPTRKHSSSAPMEKLQAPRDRRVVGVTMALQPLQ